MHKYTILILSLFFLPVFAFAKQHVFQDVPQNEWYSSYVNNLVDQGIISQNETYRPADSVTRAELIKLIIEAGNFPLLPSRKIFDDVPENSWMSSYISTAVDMNIIPQTSDKFFPERPITRGETAKYITTVFNIWIQDGCNLPSFRDVRSNHPYRDEILIAAKIGIFEGYNNKQDFKPEGNLNRAEMAKIINQILNTPPIFICDTSKIPPMLEPEADTNIDTIESFTRILFNNDFPFIPNQAPQNAVSLIFSTNIETNQVENEILSLTLTHSGFGQSEDIDEIWAEDFSGNIISNISSFSRQTNQATLTFKENYTKLCHEIFDITNEPFCKKEIRIFATFEDENNFLSHQFSIEKPEDIQLANGIISGELPIQGPKIDLVAFEAPELIIEKKFSPDTVQVGSVQDELGRFEIHNTGGDGNKNIHIKTITFKNEGNVDTQFLENFALYYQNNRITSFLKNTENDFITLTFLDSNGYFLEAGDSKLLTLRADIVRTNGRQRNINIIIDQPDQNVYATDVSQTTRIRTFFQQ